jgi:hypothetical protein
MNKINYDRLANLLVGWLAGRLAGWQLAGWLAGWLSVCLSDCLAVWLSSLLCREFVPGFSGSPLEVQWSGHLYICENACVRIHMFTCVCV